jgi:hypothetical protein
MPRPVARTGADCARGMAGIGVRWRLESVWFWQWGQRSDFGSRPFDLPEHSRPANSGASWAALIEWLMRVWPEFLRFDAQR